MACGPVTITVFSGGEKFGLRLAVIAWQRPICCCWIEPTNHLDFGKRQALTIGLQNFDVAIVVGVANDRHLLRKHRR